MKLLIAALLAVFSTGAMAEWYNLTPGGETALCALSDTVAR